MHWFSQRSNAERSALPRLLTVLLVVGSVGLLAGCDPLSGGGGPSTFPVGTWVSTAGDSYTITGGTILYDDGFGGGYKAEIVTIAEGQFNGSDTTIAAGASAAADPGFAIVKYTEVDGAGTGEVGKYNVFRWAQTAGDTAKQDFAQGYKNVGPAWPNNVNGVFTTASAAETGATNAAGYFSYAGEYERQE